MIHFKLTKKNVKRLVTTMLLIAPIVYLFGTMFTYLNGAHGDIVLAQPVYTEEYIEVDEPFSGYGSVTFTANDSAMDFFPYASYVPTPMDFEFNGVSYVSLRSVGWSDTFHSLDMIKADDSYTRLGYFSRADTSSDWGFSFSIAMPWVFYGYGKSMSALFSVAGGSYRVLSEVPTEVVPENNSANTVFLFGQFFARDNFVSDIGKDVLSDDPHGFVPFAAMIKFVDENMLNIGSLQVGLMAYGYFYWCAHVLLLMVLFDLTTFFITWVSHIGDKFGGNADE